MVAKLNNRSPCYIEWCETVIKILLEQQCILPIYVVLPPGAELMSNTSSPSCGESAITGRKLEAPCSMYWPERYSGVAPVFTQRVTVQVNLFQLLHHYTEQADLNVLTRTNRYWWIIDDQTNFGPFPQRIKVHTSVDQSLKTQIHKVQHISTRLIFCNTMAFVEFSL